VIIHSRSDTEVYRARAAAAGASGFVSKQRTAEELGPMALSLLARTADHACDTQPRGRRS
jgi:DNA-binding NarL/FixJ family response regulator